MPSVKVLKLLSGNHAGFLTLPGVQQGAYVSGADIAADNGVDVYTASDVEQLLASRDQTISALHQRLLVLERKG